MTQTVYAVIVHEWDGDGSLMSELDLIFSTEEKALNRVKWLEEQNSWGFHRADIKPRQIQD